MKAARLLILAAAISLLGACSDGSSLPANNLVVSMNANISASEPIANYTAEYQAIYNAGTTPKLAYTALTTELLSIGP